MPKSEHADLRLLAKRLRSAIDCVLKKAAADHAFAEELRVILLSDDPPAPHQKPRANDRVVFQPVAYLGEHGRERLHDYLRDQEQEDVKAIARQQKVVKPSQLRSMTQADLIAAIVDHAERRLRHGNAFLPTAEAAGDDTAPEGQQPLPQAAE